MKRFIVIILLLAAAGGSGWYFFMRNSGSTSVAAYRTADIRRGDLENLISSTGTLSAVSTVKVGSQVSGTLVAIHVDFNDEVKKGQILAELDRSMLEATVVDARATLMRAKAQLAQARAELERNRALFDKGFLSESEFLVFQTDVDVKAATVASAEAGLHKAQTNLGYAVITSPIDGIVIHRSVDPGQTIAASFQTPELFVIAEDLSRMQIEVAVDESDIGQVREGMPVRFEVQAYYEETFRGIVKQVRLQPETISNVVNYTVIVNADNTDGRLLPGMTATVDFIVDSVSDVFLVPNAAIAFKPDESFLKKLPEGAKSVGMEADIGPGPHRELNFEAGGGHNRGTGTPDSAGRGGQRDRRPGTGDPRRESPKIPDARAETGSKNLARVYLQDEAGAFSQFVFVAGVSDGAFTEIKDIVSGPGNPAAYRAVTGVDRNASSRAERTFFAPPGSPMSGPPPGAQGMRRSGL